MIVLRNILALAVEIGPHSQVRLGTFFQINTPRNLYIFYPPAARVLCLNPECCR